MYRREALLASDFDICFGQVVAPFAFVAGGQGKNASAAATTPVSERLS
jgi:hypothetical protein